MRRPLRVFICKGVKAAGCNIELLAVFYSALACMLSFAYATVASHQTRQGCEAAGNRNQFGKCKKRQ
jgi:hypothetical protein